MISKNGTTYCMVVTVSGRDEGYIKKEYLVFDDAETVGLDDAETDSFSKCGECGDQLDDGSQCMCTA